MGDEGRKEDTALLVPLRWRKGHGTEGVHGSGFPGRGHAEPCILEWCCFCGEPGWMHTESLSSFPQESSHISQPSHSCVGAR